MVRCRLLGAEVNHTMIRKLSLGLCGLLLGACAFGTEDDVGQTEQDIVGIAETEFVGALTLRGFQQPVPAFRLKSMRA